jgi:membrane protease YdiL (CAAX protease family)
MAGVDERSLTRPAGWRRWFYGEEGLRAGWCLARFIALFLLLSTAGKWLYLRLDPAVLEEKGWVLHTQLAAEGLALLLVLICVALSARLEHRSWEAYGLAPRAAFGARFWEGVLWGMVPVSILIAAISAAGGWSVTGLAEHGGALVRHALLWALFFLLVALYEEVLFRGYTLLTLARGAGFWPAALALSALFGAVHYCLKPMETWADGLSTGLLGLFLCTTVRLSGDIWLATGFHCGWNFLAMAVCGGPNTGNDGQPLPGHLLASSFHGPPWLTGGPMGPEASLFVFPLIAALFAACAWRFRGVRAAARQ